MAANVSIKPIHSFILYSLCLIMKVSQLSLVVLAAASVSGTALKKRSGFSQGEPIADNGNGGPILGKFSSDSQTLSNRSQVEQTSKLICRTRTTSVLRVQMLARCPTSNGASVNPRPEFSMVVGFASKSSLIFLLAPIFQELNSISRRVQ